jgi:NAD(P)-dependent dehydrogenase (short-subunit alcohol dehydrogenase family)
MPGRVQGKVAIVTGGASGICAATCRVLAREGAAVVCADIDDRRGEDVVAKIRESGGKARYQHLDVSSDFDWKTAIDETAKREGGLDILVNGAFRGYFGAIDRITSEDWTDSFRVTADGAFKGMKAALDVIRGGGAIVNIASVAALRGAPHNIGYSAAKSAVIAASRATAIRLAEMKRNIRVNCVVPGMILTPALEKTFDVLATAQRSPEDTKAAMLKQVPLRRIGEPEDIANAILFLASDDAKYITGTELIVDGGFNARW